MRTRRTYVAVVSAVLGLMSLGVGPASAQVVGLGAAASPAFSSPVVVGQQDAEGLIQFFNTSFGAAAAEPVTISGIQVNPSCAVSTPGNGSSPCAAPEPRPNPLAPILHLGSLSAPGTTCPGGPFVISGPDGDGDYSFTPTSGPLTLAPVGQPGTTCTIRFTFDAVQRPTDGATAVVVVASASSPSVPTPARATGSSLVTVNRGPAPHIAASAVPSMATAGTAFSATAQLSGVNSPTGTVTFRLYSDLACTVEVFSSVNPVDPASGRATSNAVQLTTPGTYHWRATYNGDSAREPSAPTPCDHPAATVTVLGVGRYTPLSPARIEDTRVGAGGLSGPLGPAATAEVQVGGRGGVPVGASAVVVNVTVTQPTAEGYLTLYPSGTDRPLAATLNFTPAKTVPNLAVVKLGPDGRLAMFNSTGTTHVIFDVAGYFVDGGSGNAGRYQPLVPARIADTRLNDGGVRLGPGQSIDVQVTGRGGAPSTGVSAAVLNVAATGTTAESYLTVYPTGEPRPLAANLNFRAGDTVSNRTMTKVGAGGKVTIYNNAGATDVVVDIGGTYTDGSVAGSQGRYVALPPSRIVDTRPGPPIPAGETAAILVAGMDGVPGTGVSAVILNVAVTQPAGPGFLTLFPNGTARPLASDLNYATGETRANLVVVRLGADGKVGLFTSNQAHVVIDVAGYFT